MPIELVVDFKNAVELGIIFSLSESDVMLTSDIVPNDAILYSTDAQTGEVLWRNALRLEALENQTIVESLAARQAVIVTSDEAFQTDKDGKRAKNPEEEQTNEDTAASSTRPGQPEADSVGHQVQDLCHAHSLYRLQCLWRRYDARAVEMPTLRAWHKGDERHPRAAKRRTQTLEEVCHRAGKSANQLMIGDFKGYTDVAKRGATSFEARQIEASKNYDNRARKLGYENVVDRFDNRESLFQMSLFPFCVLPEFPRTYDQRLLGVGPGYGKKGHHYVHTVYVSGGESGDYGDYDADLHAFPWLFSYNGKMLSLAQFVAQVNILPGMRNLVTFGGKFPTLRIREICTDAMNAAKRLAPAQPKTER